MGIQRYLSKVLTAGTLLLGLAAPSAQAQWVVVDPAAISQAQQDELVNLITYIQISAQTLETFSQLAITYQSIHGIRNFQALLNNPTIRQFLPPGWANTLTSVESACSNQKAAAMANCVAIKGQAAMDSILTSAEAKVATRRQEVQSLIDQLNSTPDEKDTADLHARLQGEVANLLTEQSDLLASQYQSNQSGVKQQNAVAQSTFTGTAIADPLTQITVAPITAVTD